MKTTTGTLLESLRKGDLLSCYSPSCKFVGIYRVRNKTTLDPLVVGFGSNLGDTVLRIGVRGERGGNPVGVNRGDVFNCYHDQMGTPYIYSRWSPGTPINGKIWDEIYEPEMMSAGLFEEQAVEGNQLLLF